MESPGAFVWVDDLETLTLNQWIELGNDVSGRSVLESIEPDVFTPYESPWAAQDRRTAIVYSLTMFIMNLSVDEYVMVL